jgi:hypothetical protein
MKKKSEKKVFLGSLEHRGGKKLSQPGTEFFHKIKANRKPTMSGYRGKKG